MSKFLREGLLSEMNRARDFITINNDRPNGIDFIAASLMKKDIQDAEEAISTGDIIQMLISFKKFKYCD